MEHIGVSIKKARKSKKVTQKQLAILAGIPYATLVKVERGQVKNPTINTLQNISKALDISVDSLINQNEY